METVTFKIDEGLLKSIEHSMKQHHYMTKTEFIRDAIRDKIRKEEAENILSLYGTSKRRTTNKQLHKAGERAFAELERSLK